jgi:hypothetical protein
LAIGHRSWGVASHFPTLVSQCLSAFLRVIHRMVLVTQITAILHAGSQVTCHSFLNLCLWFNRLSRPGRTLLRSGSVILLLGNPYTEAMVAVKSRAAL